MVLRRKAKMRIPRHPLTSKVWAKRRENFSAVWDAPNRPYQAEHDAVRTAEEGATGARLDPNFW